MSELPASLRIPPTQYHLHQEHPSYGSKARLRGLVIDMTGNSLRRVKRLTSASSPIDITRDSVEHFGESVTGKRTDRVAQNLAPKHLLENQ